MSHFLSTTCLVLGTLLNCLGQLSAANFLDDYSSDRSASYQGTDTFGSSGAFSISGGVLSLTPASGNTYNVFHNTAPKDFYLTVSTTDRGPNTGTEDGIRLNLNSTGFRSRTYRNGSVTDADYHSHPVGWTRDITLIIYRDTTTEYRVGYDTGSGIQILDHLTISETAGVTGLYVGLEAFGNGTRQFDDLEIGTTAQQPVLSSFSASTTSLSQSGPVTLTWTASNATKVTLNGADVTGQSPRTTTVKQSQDFVLQATGSRGSQVSRTLRVTVGESFSIAAVADPQYADVPVGWRGGGREPEEGVTRLTHAVSEYNKRNLDWGVVLGDLIDFDDIAYGNPPPGTVDGVHDWANTNAILGAWEQLNVPRYLVLGNHEFYVPNADPDGLQKPYSVFRKFGFDQTPYYNFRHKGFHFVVMMADWRYLDYDPALPEYTVAKDYYDDFSGPQKRWWNGAISLKQRKWFMELMDESLALGERVVCMVHDPVHRPSDGHSLLNNLEMLEILNGYPNIVMWLNGHNHGGDYAIEQGRHHLNLKGMQNAGNHWYQIDFSPAEITVYQAENTTTPVYNLDILRPQPTLPSPAGFSVTDSSGDALIRWRANPAGATQIVVERRHVSPLNAELPSTAQTLSWQVLTRLPLLSARSHLDSPSQPVSEYKYRIRFLDGAEESAYSQALAVPAGP